MIEDGRRKALVFEKEIALFYLEEGVVPGNILVQKLFLELAKQEIDHVLFISEALVGQALTVATASVEETVRRFFEQMPRDILKKHTTQVEALETARRMEKNGLSMYVKSADEAQTPEEKAFFSLLVAQEAKHLESVDNVLRYLTGTGDWFAEDEARVWNWMNL